MTNYQRLFPRRVGWTALAVSAFALAGCGSKDESINCDNLLDAQAAPFYAVESLVTSSGKGCSSAGCHGSERAESGYRLDKSALIYDAFTTHIDSVYGQVASGSMPEGGSRWNDQDLALVRTWYCNGASYE